MIHCVSIGLDLMLSMLGLALFPRERLLRRIAGPAESNLPTGEAY
jgi:hypothetical protein